MTKAQAMTRLKSLGTAQNRKVYARHGVSGSFFGVSFANLRKLAKEIGRNTALAEQLWETENHDARMFATIVADPKDVASSRLDAWAKDLRNYVDSDALAALAGRTPYARHKMERWSRSKNEWIGRAGWTTLAHLAMDAESMPDASLEEYLGTIEREIHGRKNYTRYAMNSALIAIGGRGGALAKRALDVAKRIGTVDVDHGETGCKTPDAAPYIRKMLERNRAKGPGRSARTKRPA